MADFIETAGKPGDGFDAQFKDRELGGIPQSGYLLYVLPYVPGIPPAQGTTDVGAPRLVSGFQNIQGLDAPLEVKESSESEDFVVKKSPGRINFSDLTLQRGFDDDSFMRQWYLQRGSLHGRSKNYMADIVILKLGSDFLTVERIIAVKNAWVKNYRPDDLNSTATDPWFENLEICHEGWGFVAEKGATASGSTTNMANAYSSKSGTLTWFKDDGVTPSYTYDSFINKAANGTSYKGSNIEDFLGLSSDDSYDEVNL